MNPNPTSTEPHIARLFIYPIKSCAGIELPQARLTDTGLARDRQFMLVDAQGRFLSQRELSRMALIRPEIEGRLLRVQAPGMALLSLAFDAPAEAATVLPVQLWGHNMPALDAGAEAAAWFSAFLGQAGLRLVRFDPSHRRASDTEWTGGDTALNLFSDGFPLLVLSQSALDGLNRRLLAQGQPEAQLQRFRPNIVIDGVPEHEEDLATELLLPDEDGNEPTRLRLVKPCPRCPIPNIDPGSAHSTPHVIDCLNTYRQDPRVNGAVSFGMNAIIQAGLGRTLRVGQSLELDYGFE
ncbi:MAG: MOSC N-terminal beta barrel domain-containing protein [Pseudomonadota bacterium]